MLRTYLALLAFFAMTAFIVVIEFVMDRKSFDVMRRRMFEEIDQPCRKFLRRTKERPVWRLCWICAVLVTFFTSILYCIAPPDTTDLDLCSFMILSFSVAFLSAHAALSYYNWHLLCPDYDCSYGAEA